LLAAGVDVGSAFVKAVVCHQGRAVGAHVAATTHQPEQAAGEALRVALEHCGSHQRDLGAVVVCGAGRHSVQGATTSVTEVTAFARAAAVLYPSAGQVVDVGSHGIRASLLDRGGNVRKFLMNDRCAAGTGCFLEAMSKALNMDPVEAGRAGICSSEPARIGSTCAVFAESEVVSLVARGRSREDIIGGLYSAVAERVAQMLRKLGGRGPIVLAGGVAESPALSEALRRAVKTVVHVPESAQTVGALGAALIGEGLPTLKAPRVGAEIR
jgi:predicted CoA-substrate-specific enzyme activase